MRLICDHCGVHLRVAHPHRARVRPCPRCGVLLESTIARALNPWGIPLPAYQEAAVEEAPRASGRVGLLVATAGLLAAGLVIHLASIILQPPVADGPQRSQRAAASSTVPLSPMARAGQVVARPSPLAEPVFPDLEQAPPDELIPEVAAESPVGPAVAATNLALRTVATPVEASGGGSASTSPVAPDRPAYPIDRQHPDLLKAPPPPPEPAPPAPPAPARSEATDQPERDATSASQPSPRRRFLVRDQAGRTVVAREHGTHDGRVAVVLPDGTIGWPTTEVPTDEPFQPSTAGELEKTLSAGDYATFRVIRTEHYLVFYQSTEAFARTSADLLENLYAKLTQALRDKNLPVTDSEFPLIAVIFRSEDDFRANRQVAREVQAYYEILSNRIFFFEKGRRDAASPEVSALRKPQTVAHEGTHQLLHNVGIQPRMSPWPLWLVEGLAEYCSPPKSTKKGSVWAGLGQVNAIHLTTIRDLDDPMSSQVQGGPRAPSNRDRNRPLVEYLATRTELTPTDYALSWGLTHYLAQEKDRVDQFVAYIRRLNRLQPFETRTPEQQLADFRAAFGDDLAKLDAKVGRHLARLKVPDAQALPFYAVLAQQPGPGGSLRRMAMVSQSPEMIRQWVETAGMQVEWQAVPHPNRTRAMMTADGWVHPNR